MDPPQVPPEHALEETPQPRQDHNENSPKNAPPSHVCQVCHSTFRRPEHLKRHKQTALCHAELKPYVCGCGKRFSRTDSLRRHEGLHAMEGEGGRAVLGSAKASRACFACVAARTRCVGEPCRRCGERGVECLFPQKRRRVGLPGPEEPSARSDLSAGNETSGLDEQAPRSSVVSSVADPPGFQRDLAPPPPDAGLGISIPAMNASGVTYEDSGLQLQTPMSDAIGVNLGGMENRRQTYDYNNVDSNGFSVLNWLPLSFPVTGFAQDDLASLSYWQSPIPQNTSLQEPSTALDNNIEHRNDLSEEVDSESPASNERHAEGASLADTTSDQEVTGDYYVDGNGARRSKAAVRSRERLSDINSVSPATNGSIPRSGRQFQNLDAIDNLYSKNSNTHFSQKHYQEIVSCFEALQGTPSSGLFNMPINQIPSFEVLEHLLQLSIQNFLPAVPIIHAVSLRDEHWVLLLALACIGVHYIENETNDELKILHDFLLEAIEFVSHQGAFIEKHEVQLIQIKLLACIGYLYNDGQRFDSRCVILYEDLITFYSSPTQSHRKDSFFENCGDCTWKVWIERETISRTAYYIWLLDCMQAFHAQRKKRLAINEIRAPLPCQENIWEADSSESWKKIYDSSQTNPPLSSALETLYVSKKVDQSIGEFGRVLLIYALFEQTWAMKSHFLYSFSSWVPTARISNSSFHKRTARDLAADPTFSRWRNCACDCLDVLHWSANSKIGAALGMEHSTVHHLHLARIVLLTPHEHFRSLALHLTSQASQAPYTLQESVKEIQQWIIDDQYKARLAMIHTGALFWHVRRYSVDAFYEAEGIFLASLAMWAYSRYHPPSLVNKLRTSTAEIEGSPIFINLDRPIDDELVQMFVKSGEEMVANISGVGNLRDRGSAVKVLRMGCRYLEKLDTWGNFRSYLGLLTKLADAKNDDV